MTPAELDVVRAKLTYPHLQTRTDWSKTVRTLLAEVERLQERLEYVEAQREAASQVAASAYRDALTEQVMENGHPIGSLAELAGVAVTDETRNFQIQAGIADVLREKGSSDG